MRFSLRCASVQRNKRELCSNRVRLCMATYCYLEHDVTLDNLQR